MALVGDGVLNVVDGNVIIEDRLQVPIHFFYRIAGEADERRIRQRVAHVSNAVRKLGERKIYGFALDYLFLDSG